MRHLNKIATAFCAATLGMLSLTSCEGGDLFSVDSPDWIASKADSIAAAKAANQGTEVVIEGLEEDVYNIGNAEYTAPFFTLGKTYVVPAGQKWQAQFNLTVNPDNKYFKNFFIVVNAFAGDALGDEYFVMRYDNDPSKNSEWNTVGTEFDRNLVGGNFNNTSGDDDLDPSVQGMNGKVTLTVDRTNGGLYIEMSNGTLTKTYTQTSTFPSTGSDADIACRVGVEGSLVSFLGSTIEPIGGFTSRDDKQPASLAIKGLPAKVLAGTDFETLVANVTADVTFENVPAPVSVKGEELKFEVIPNLSDLGTKTLVAAYAKTYKGESAAKPVIGYATFQVVDKMYESIGATDNSTPFWGAHSENVKVNPGETVCSTFYNYTSGANNWNNFCVVLCTQDGGTEYAVVRADNYGWGQGYEGNANLVTSGTQGDWATWLAAMDDALVTVSVTNNGGSADVRIVMVGNNGVTYTQNYLNITPIDGDDLDFHMTVDGCHLVLE